MAFLKFSFILIGEAALQTVSPPHVEMRSLPKAQKSQSIWSSAQVPASALILSFGNCHVRWWFPLRIKSQIHKVRSIIIEQKNAITVLHLFIYFVIFIYTAPGHNFRKYFATRQRLSTSPQKGICVNTLVTGFFPVLCRSSSPVP